MSRKRECVHTGAKHTAVHTCVRPCVSETQKYRREYPDVRMGTGLSMCEGTDKSVQQVSLSYEAPIPDQDLPPRRDEASETCGY